MTYGVAWLIFALALAIHVADEAAHDFLAVYNPIAHRIRTRFLLPVPTFRFSVWLGGLIAGIGLLLALTPLAFAGAMKPLAIALAAAAGIGNGALHLIGSLWLQRRLPGTLSAPLLIAAGAVLLTTAL
jgi:hypothetical protein